MKWCLYSVLLPMWLLSEVPSQLEPKLPFLTLKRLVPVQIWSYIFFVHLLIKFKDKLTIFGGSFYVRIHCTHFLISYGFSNYLEAYLHITRNRNGKGNWCLAVAEYSLPNWNVGCLYKYLGYLTDHMKRILLMWRTLPWLNVVVKNTFSGRKLMFISKLNWKIQIFIYMWNNYGRDNH